MNYLVGDFSFGGSFDEPLSVVWLPRGHTHRDFCPSVRRKEEKSEEKEWMEHVNMKVVYLWYIVDT